MRHLIIILTFISFGLSAADLTDWEVKLHLNSRNAKIDSIEYDWYWKVGASFEIDTNHHISFFLQRERDNGVVYHSYDITYYNRFMKLNRYADTETMTDLYSGSFYYPVGNFRIGYDCSYNRRLENNIYLGFKYKDWFSWEVIWFDDIERFYVNIIPSYRIKNHFKVGIDAGLLIIDDRVKWNAGFTIKILRI